MRNLPQIALFIVFRFVKEVCRFSEFFARARALFGIGNSRGIQPVTNNVVPNLIPSGVPARSKLNDFLPRAPMNFVFPDSTAAHSFPILMTQDIFKILLPLLPSLHFFQEKMREPHMRDLSISAKTRNIRRAKIFAGGSRLMEEKQGTPEGRS